ncbi:MAG: anaerobic ribonucleoside-triphosphate reductase activating protein [bacterium]|nr:anaerobic ribonucleoside-triphosphate reductase activating protein [bacterium]
MIFGGFEKCTLVDYPGKVACMVYTIGCNFRCPYCHNPELVDETVETTYSEAVILDFLDTRKGLLDGVVITGGEPTMHEELPAFARRVKEKGFLVKLDTNGTNPEMLRRAIDESWVDYVAMDMKSPLETYSQTVARAVDVEAIRESISILLASSIEYEFRTTIVKSLLSCEDLKRIGEAIRGAKCYYLQKFVPTKILNPQFRRKVTYTDEEFIEFQKIMHEYVETCGIR